MGMPAATTPLAPSMPTEKSAMCMDPPFPLLYPVARPNNSHIILVASAPLAKVWPCPRWVDVSMSSLVSAWQTPAATASCPVDRCSGPRTKAGLAEAAKPQAATPPWLAISAAFSNSRMRNIDRYKSAIFCMSIGVFSF